MNVGRNGRASKLVALGFLAPALVLLGGLVIWPAAATIYRSFFDSTGSSFVGADNYRQLLSQERLRSAVFNTFIWVAIFPIVTTVIGLVLAVISDKMKTKSAFRLMLFMPAAIALLSAGIIWQLVYAQSPDQGALNAAIDVPVSVFAPEGSLHGAKPSSGEGQVSEEGSILLDIQVGEGSRLVEFGVLGFPEKQLGSSPESAAVDVSQGSDDSVNGVLWRDTGVKGGQKEVVDAGELAVANVELELADGDGKVATTRTESDGTFSFDGVADGSYTLSIPASQTQKAWGGIQWLSPTLVTLATVVAAIWVWGGFALLVTSSGMAAIPQQIFEAARIDGASQWQVFRYITTPLLKPVLGVVFVSLTIHALKMFDLIMGIAPGPVQDDANTVALEMWRTSFTGVGNKGLGSAVAVFLFVLALPIMVFNIKRFTSEEGQT